MVDRSRYPVHDATNHEFLVGIGTLIGLKAVLAESNEAKQKDLYGQIQRKIADEAVHAFMFQLPRTGVYAAKLRGIWKNSPVSVTDLAGLSWVD